MLVKEQRWSFTEVSIAEYRGLVKVVLINIVCINWLYPGNLFHGGAREMGLKGGRTRLRTMLNRNRRLLE
jgi:hypothetical protein